MERPTRASWLPFRGLRRNLSALLADRFESLREVGEEVGRRHMVSLDGFLATLVLFYGSDESSPPAGGMIGLHWLRATSTSCLRPATGRPPVGADDSPVRNDGTRSAWCNEFLWHTEQSRLLPAACPSGMTWCCGL